MIAALQEGRPFELYGDGTSRGASRTSTTSVEATILAMERGAAGAIYNVGGGVEVSMLEAIETLERLSGATPRGRPHAAGVAGDAAPDAARTRRGSATDTGLGAANLVRAGTCRPVALGR